VVIEIMGIDSEKTSALEAAVREALSSLALDAPADVRRVADPAAIIARGARRWPALRVEGKVVCAGALPAAADVRAWLQAAEA
jgi:hypothetical protein